MAADTPTAHVSAEIADWLDPKGTLRESGLMKIDKNMPVSKDVRAGIKYRAWFPVAAFLKD